MNKLNKHDVVIQAVKDLRSGQFGATAIKVELEGSLGRRGGDCEGYHQCYECEGQWENVNECDACGTTGFIRWVAIDEEWVSCDSEHDGANECSDCYGRGYHGCEYCEEGSVDCNGDCDGTESYDVSFCHDFIMEKLSELGLAERVAEGYHATSHNLMTQWIHKGALKYAEFYNDGSVDSEFTFTLSLKKAENIFLLPKVIDIFNQLAEEIGNGIGVNGAGMHMALLNDKGCRYPYSAGMDSHSAKFHNFSKSMKLLLPALFFLGSSNGHSRAMGYRRPEVGLNTHRAAIDWRGGALEFRVFDTCYDTPDVILDNIVVMRNCMRFWSRTYKTPKLDKITKQIRFGDNTSFELERLYQTATHLEVLNAGLRKLKPSYYTIGEIKQQRKFKTTKHSLKSKLTEYRKGLRIEYREYSEREKWSKEAQRHHYISMALEARARNNANNSSDAEVIAEAERQAQSNLENDHKPTLALQDFINQKLEEYANRGLGEYSITA